jgi:hypothetical protein
MKKILFITLFCLVVCSSATTVPALKLDFVTLMAIIAGVWEVIGRAIPSVGQITVIGKLIEILSWLSNFLNHKK